jgi:hypothetical protein
MFARLLLIALLAAGCEKTTHENIEKWAHTEKGPGKLDKALRDETIDADLSAHAAAVMMVKTGKDNDARAALDLMSAGRRADVVAKLVPMLWDLARVEGEMTKPGGSKVVAKDQLLAVRKYASDATKQQIDTYLLDWYCVASYEGRSELGLTLGAPVMRMLGDKAAKKLISVANGVIAAPGQEKVKNRVGPALLLGLAATCTPETVEYLLEMMKLAPDRHDDMLPKRAMDALMLAYDNPGGLFDACPSTTLQASVDHLVPIAQDEGLGDNIPTDALLLIRRAGMPACLPALVAMVGRPHSNPVFKYATTQQALRCGGSKAIPSVVRALPDVAYTRDQLVAATAKEIKDMAPRAEVLSALRELLDDKSRVARWVAIETLAEMKSVEDAPRLAAVSSSEKLAGFWGDPAKPDPTLGQRAKELSDQLSKGAK